MMVYESYFQELRSCLASPDGNTRKKCALLYRLLVEVLDEATVEAGVSFSGTFAKLHYVCRRLEISTSDYALLNHLRVRLFHLDEQPIDSLEKHWRSDVAVVARFIGALYKVDVPKDLRALLVDTPLVPNRKRSERRVWRVVVEGIKEDGISIVAADDGESVPLKLIPDDSISDTNQSYLLDMVSVGTQLNLIHATLTDEGVRAEWIILEPDYLMDVSSIAKCFHSCGVRSEWFPLNRLLPAINTFHTILGNLASQMLDESVHGQKADYPTTISRYFRRNALSFVTCKDFRSRQDSTRFHAAAKEQQTNIENLVQRQFKEELGIKGGEQVILEPSFVCEILGLQGRMDLLTLDLLSVVEQKSGKKGWPNGGAVESHEVQMVLYLAMLHYGLGVRYSDLSAHLLYSKYAEKAGIVRVGNVPRLLALALKVRNEIVARELSFSLQGARDYFENFCPTMLCDDPNSKLWREYVAPQVEPVLRVMQGAEEIEKDYFYRFHRFLSMEHRCSKLGAPLREAGGFASAWLCSYEEKRQAGTILAPLTLSEKAFERDEDGGIVAVNLATMRHSCEDGEITAPNFRKGDIVLLYSYEEGYTPDLRRGFVFRASVQDISAEGVVLRLRSPQTNAAVFQHRNKKLWAVEPDFMESAGAGLFRGLYAFLQGNADRKDLLLGKRAPRVHEEVSLLTQPLNEEMAILVRKAKRSRDIFLLVGPPGTGKTSVGLMSILREELADSGNCVLLSAFTNRAVDEICSKLVKEGLDFLRLGNSLSCSKESEPFLFENKTKTLKRKDEIERLLQSVRIVVGTTATLSGSGVALMGIKRFSLAIIDEASQLLEPHLLPLLMAETNHQPSIGRFVFIGDHKQLPAVVQQSERDSRVEDVSLRNIGLTDCRRSLFERLITVWPETCVHRFTRQGRMHPEVAKFPNRYFYGGTLTAIPLPHQEVEMEAPRVVFHDCRPSEEAFFSPKTNLEEARLIARICVSEYERMEQEGREFMPQSDLGVIVPYRHQIALIRRELAKTNFPLLTEIPIDTVERFQGSECEVIIYGFTISRYSQFRFLCNSCFKDEMGDYIDRKLNVALTRARQKTHIVGNAELLIRIPLFAELLRTYAIPT